MNKYLGGCKHAGSANLHYKTLKTEKNINNRAGVVSQLVGYLPPPLEGVKNITEQQHVCMHRKVKSQG